MSTPIFESYRVWHDARRLTAKIYEVTKAPGFAHDFALRDQIRRAAISAMSNIAEGYERGGEAELRRFLRIAKGSAGEVRSQLYAAEDIGYLTRELASELRAHTLALARQLAHLIANGGRPG